MENIKVTELKNRLNTDESFALIDVRTPAEFEELHVTGAKNLPLGLLSQENLEKLAPKGSSLFFICQSGGRSSQASQKVESIGLWNVYNVMGGTNAAIDAGLPISKGLRAVMSIERQVRVIAGALVLLGVALGYLISTYFFFLSAAVGAGLVFAGVTNYCGMAILLERCPWNKVSTNSET